MPRLLHHLEHYLILCSTCFWFCRFLQLLLIILRHQLRQRHFYPHFCLRFKNYTSEELIQIFRQNVSLRLINVTVNESLKGQSYLSAPLHTGGDDE